MILHSRDLRDQMIYALKREIKDLKDNGIKPTLAIVRVGDNKADISYEKGLEKSAQLIGVELDRYIFDTDVKTIEITQVIENLNHDTSVGGILIFRPLPTGIDENKINQMIAPEKDVDCVTPYNQVNLLVGKANKKPATALSALKILKSVVKDLKGKNVLIINRTMVIGKPLALMLLEEDATVTIAHSKTRNLKEISRRADILVTGIGKAKYIDDGFVSQDSVVIDCGISFENGQMCGDVDFEKVKDKVKWITPVPQGVGALTNICLLDSVLDTFRK